MANNKPPTSIAEMMSGSHGQFSRPDGISTRNIVAERAAYAPMSKLGKYDVGLTPAIYETASFANPRLAQQYYRADNQSAGKQLWNGFRSRALSIPLKVGEGFGYLIGAVDAAAHGDMDRMYDNAIVGLFSDLDNKIKEALPVYQSKAYTEGSWVRKLGTTSFWATDGFDGLAFLASAYLPGGLFSKVGSVSKWLMGVERLGVLGKASRGLGKAMAATKAATGVSTSALLTTVYNTVTEAGFEAHDVNTMLRQQLAQQKGFSSFEDAPEDVQDVIRDQAAQGAARTFQWNTAALLVPNFLQTKWLFGSKAIEPDDIIFKVRRGEMAVDAARKNKLAYLSQFGHGLASEGLWEENIQTAVQQYEARRAKGLHENDAVIGPLAGAIRNGMSFAKSVLTLGYGAPDAGSEEDEAGSAIALGGLIGGGMSLYGQYIENLQLQAVQEGARTQWQKFQQVDRASGNLLIEDVRSPYKTFGTTTIKDENGKEVTSPNFINPQTGKREHDPRKWTKVMMNGASNQQLLAEAEAAFANGDPHWEELNRQMALMSHVYRLAASGLKREDVQDLIELDTEAILKDGEQFGLTEDVDKVKADLLKYLDIFFAEKKEALKGDTTSAEGRAFSIYRHRNLYYMAAKAEALSKLEGLRDNEGLAALIEDNNNTYNFFLDNMQEARKMFDERLMPIDLLGKRFNEILTELKKEGLDTDTKRKLSEELGIISYKLEELKDAFGTTFLDYGENAEHLGQPATVVADGFRTQEASQLLRRDTDSRVQRNKMRLGKEAHIKQDVETALDNFERQGDESSLDDLLAIVDQTGSISSEHKAAVIDAIAKLDDQAAEAEALALELEPLTNPEALDRMYMDGELSDAQKAFLEPYSADSIEGIEEAAQAAATRADELWKTKKEREDKADRLANIPFADLEDLKKMDWPSLVEAHVNDRFRAVENLIASFEENQEGFLRGAETAELFNQMALVNLVFKDRKDTPDALNKKVTTKAKKLMDKLSELLAKVQENKARRIVIQEAAELQKKDSLLKWTGFENGSFSNTHPFRAMLLSALNGNEDRLIEVEEQLKNNEYSGAIEYLLLFVTANASKETKAAFTEYLSASYLHLVEVLDPNKILRALSGVYNNPLKYGNTLLKHTAGITELFADYKSPFFAYAKDKDLTKLQLELSRLAGASGIIPGLDKAASDKVFEKIGLISNMVAVRSLFLSLHANLDAKDMLEAELSLGSTFALPDQGGVPPSAQQTIAFREAVRNMFIPSTGVAGSEITVLKGILGSGKSLVGVKAAVAMWKKLTGATDENIFAFGHTETSSEIIASSVYSDPNIIHSAQEFVAAQDLSQIRLVVVDEAMAVDYATWEAVYNRVLAENKNRNADEKIYILALGDPAQFTNEPEESTYVGGNVNSQTKDTSPLSVVYRTNVSSIVDMVMEFKDKPIPVSFIVPTTSHGINDLIDAANIDGFYGVNGGSLAEMLEILQKPSTKKRLVVVNNETLKADLTTKVPKDVRVLTYFEAQSTQADQVFIYIDKSQPNHLGRAFDEATFNSVMYTMIGRAKQSVFIANPGLEIRNPIINEDLAKSKENLELDVLANANAYEENIEESKNMVQLLYPDAVIASKENTEQTSKRPTKDPRVTIEETEGTGGQEAPVNEESGEKMPEQIIEPPKVAPEVKTVVEDDKGRTVQFSHSFAYPTNSFPDFDGQRLDQAFPPGSPMRIVATKPRGSKYPFELEVIAQKRNGKWAVVAVVSGEEIFETSEGLAELYKLAQALPPEKYAKGVNRDAEGFDYFEELNAATVGDGIINHASGVQYELIPVGKDGKNLDNSLATFYNGFYADARGGLGATPRVELLKDNKIDWERLSKYVTMKIFSRSDLRNWPYREFAPQVGVPYMVIEDPSVEGADVTRTQYMRFEPRKILPSDSIMKTLANLKVLVDMLEKDFPNLKLGSNNFSELFGYYTDQVYKATEDGIQKKEIVNTLETLQQYRDTTIAKLDTTKLTTLAAHLDSLAPLLLGVEFGVLHVSKAEAQRIVKEDNGREFEGFKASGVPNNYYIKLNGGGKYEAWQLSYSHSSAQKAVNAIATANESVDDIVIRVERYTTNRSGARTMSKFGKSLMAADRSEKNFYRHFRAVLREFLVDSGVPEKELIDPETGKFYAAFQLEAFAKELLEKYMSKEAAQVELGKLDKTKAELKAKFSVNPINSTTLGKIVSSTNLRLPLNMQDFNKLGSKLNSEASRDKINSLVNGRVERVIPTTVSADIVGVLPIRSPEQEIKRKVVRKPKVQTKARKHLTTAEKNLPKSTIERAKGEKFRVFNDDVDFENPFKEWKDELDQSNPLTPFVLRLLEKVGDQFKGVFPFKAEVPGVAEDKGISAFMVHRIIDGRNYLAFSPSPSRNIFESPLASEFLLHELIHVLTTQELRDNPSGEFASRLRVLRKAYDDYTKKHKLKRQYAVGPMYDTKDEYTMLAEFIAQFAKPEMAARLKEIRFDNKTLWDQILQAILDFLGVTESNAYDAGLAAVEMLYANSSIKIEEEGMISLEQDLQFKEFVEQKIKDAKDKGGNSDEIVEQIEEIAGDESMPVETRVDLINTLFDTTNYASIAETLGADVSNILNLETFTKWIAPEMELEELKKVKRQYELLHQMFHSAMAYPEKKVISRMVKLAKNLEALPALDLPLLETSEVRSFIGMMYSYGLNKRDRSNLASAFDRKGAVFQQMSDTERIEYLVDLYFADPDTLAKEKQYPIQKFIKDVNALTNLLNIKGSVIDNRWNEAFKVEALSENLATGNNVGTVKFIDDNFHSVEHFRKARRWMYEALYNKLSTNGLEGLPLTRRQIIYALYQEMADEIIRLKGLVDLGVNYSDATDVAMDYGALRSMAKEYNGAPLLFYMLTEVYPNWSVASIEDIEEDFEALEVDELTEGIKKETQENERLNIETRLSDSVKEFLSFIRTQDNTGFLGSKHTFFLTVKLVTEFLDTSRLDGKTWDKQYQTAIKNISSANELTIIQKLNTLVRDALQEVDRTDVAVWVYEDSMSQSKIGVAFAKEGNIVNLAVDEVRAKVDPKNFLIRNWTFEDAFNQLNSWGAEISAEEFSQLVSKAKALNSLRELHNSISSLTEKNYMVGSVLNDMGLISTSYINAAGFGVDKSLASQVKGSLYAFDLEKGIEKLSEEPIIMNSVYPGLSSQNPESIINFLKFLGLSGLVNHLDVRATKSPEIYEAIKGFIDRTRDKGKFTTIDEFLEDQRSIFTAISRAVKYNIDTLRQTSIVDSKGHKIYKMVPTSFFYDVMNFFQRAASRKESAVSGTTGSLGWMLNHIPEHLKTDFYQHSPFVTGNQKIYQVSEHDASTNENSLKVTGFTRENDRQFFIRQFVHGFLDMIPTYAGQITYGQFSYQPSNKPRIPVARIKLLNDTEIKENLGRMYDQLKSYPDMQSLKTKSSTRSDELGINASVMKEAMQEHTSKELAVEYAYQKLISLADQYLKTALSEQIPLPANLEVVKDKLLGSVAAGRFAYLKEELDKIPSNLEVKKKTETGERFYDTETLLPILQPLMRLFYLNNYVNSYFFNQLYLGPYDMYKSVDDVVKRIAGALGPGIKPLVDDQIGTNETFRVLILDDRNRTENNIRDLLEKLLPKVSNTYSKEARDLDIREAVQFFKDFASTDAQGFMSEKRWNNLSKGYGAAWNLGNVMKPIYFGIHAMPMMKDGKVIDFPVPVYSKLSSVKVSTELAKRFPGIAALKNYMDTHNIDEIHFKSATKLGSDKDLTSLDEIEPVDISQAGFTAPVAYSAPKNVLTLSNRNYKMQFNPRAKIDSHVSIFTQLMYFMNILDTNVSEVEDAYASVAMLMENALADLNEEFIKDGRIRESVLRDRVARSMTSPGSERIAQLLRSGVSLNNPTVANRAISQLASMVEKSVQKIKLPGSKLVLQSDEFITKNSDPSVETASNIPSRLKYVTMDNGGFAAEVIVPMHLLTPDLRESLAKGEDLFLTPDLFGFRIPSTELHSAVPLKIVGVYDSHETNVIIAPFELVYLHGSDFDVDSLFVASRENLTNLERTVLGVESTKHTVPVGYEQKGKKLVFSRDSIDNYLDNIAEQKKLLLEEASINLEQADFYRQEIGKLDRLAKSLKKKYAKNVIFELMMQVITKPANRARMLTPIVMANFNDMSNEDSIASFLDKLGLWESKATKDLSRADYALEAYKFVQDGAMLTGVFANNIKVLAYLYRAGLNFKPALVRDRLKFSFEVNGKVEVFDRIDDYDRETGTLMWQYQDGLVNLAIDNLNEQTLSKLGVNLQTGNAFSALLGMGFPLKDAVLLMKTAPSLAISKDRPFDKVSYIRQYRKERDIRKGNRVLNRDDLILAATGQLDMNNLEHKWILSAVLDILEKAYEVGDSVFTTSRALGVIRSVPGTPEKLTAWKKAVNTVFGKLPYTIINSVQSYDSPWGLRDAHKAKQVKTESSGDYAFVAPNFLASTPHVLSAIKSVYFLDNLLKNSILKLSDGHSEFAKHIKETMQFREFGLDRIEEGDIIEELEHFLFSSLFLEDLDNVEDYQFRNRKTRLTRFSAFANRLADQLDAAIKEERQKQYADRTYKMNEFLENLVVNRNGGIINIRLASSVSPDAADIAGIRKGFDALPTNLQEDLVTYLVISTGFKLTSTSYAPYVDETNFKRMDSEFLELSKKFASSATLRNKYKDAFKVALAFKYADKLPYFNKKQRDSIIWASKTDGFENGIYYDFKIHQEDLDPKDREYPQFIGVVRFPNESEGRTWKEYEVYRRINDYVNEKVEVVYYQKIGRKTFDGFYVDPETFSFENNLPADIARVFVYDLKSPFTFNQKVASRLKPGQIVMITSFDDPMGVLAYRAKVKEVKVAEFVDGTKRFDIEVDKLDSQAEQSTQWTVADTTEYASIDKAEAYAENIRRATTGYSDIFKSLIARSTTLREDPTDVNRYITDAALKIIRVTADDGAINKMRARPFTKDQEERARSIVDAVWKERPKTTKLQVKGLEGEKTYEEAYEALLTKFISLATRGTLIHKYMEYYLTVNPDRKAEVLRQIRELHNEVDFNSAWITQGGWLDILKKTGVNIFDDVTDETSDRVVPELKIFDDKYTFWGGTADFVFQKANGNFGIRDFKTGWGFNNVEARAMFKYGGGTTRNIMQTPRNTAKLQLMLYALIMKIGNPSIKFDSLEVTWIPAPDKTRMYDHQARVEVGDYLGMIQSYMRSEMPEIYKKMQEEMGESFNRLWDPEEYEQSYRYNTKLRQARDESRSVLQEKLDELRKLTFFSLSEYESPGKKEVKVELEKEARMRFKDVMELINDLGVKEHEINDISFLSLWLSSNAHQLSGYIQLYDKMLRKAKMKVDARKTVYRTKFKAKLEAWLDDYYRVYGKSPLEYIPFTKGMLNFFSSEKLFDWLYKEIKDPDGHVVGSAIRTTAEDWEEAKKMYPNYGKWQERIAFAKFLTDTYDSFFIDKKSEYGVAVANRNATFREKVNDEGELVMIEVTNLDLQNEYRASRQAAPFKYTTGWFPKVPKLLEELGYIWNKPYLEEVWRRNFTIFNEANYDQEFNNIEVIPMSYLGNEYVDSTGAFSLNAEVQFDKFVTRMLMKEEAEDVYGFGKAMMLYLQAKTKDGSLVYKNTIDYLETALEMQVRGRREYDVPFLSRNSNMYRSANGDLNRANWAKVIRTFRSMAAAPIMWLKPLAGTANGIFTYMYTLKEAVKNDIVKSKQIGNFFGINGDEYMFGVADLAWATSKWFELQIDAMQGKLKDNKMFMLAKHLGYLPTNFGWSEDSANLITTRNKIFEQSTMYMFHSIFEEGVAFITMGAQLHALKAGDSTVFDRYELVDKTDEDGTQYKIIQWDGYKRGLIEQKDGSLRELTELDENEIRRLFHVYERMHGGYRDDERTKLEYLLLGEVFMQFKRYLPNVLKNVMGSKGTNLTYGAYVDAPSYKEYKTEYNNAEGDPLKVKQWAGRVVEGRWRVFAGNLLSYLPIKASIGEKESNTTKLGKLLGVHANESYRWEHLSDGQKEQIVDVYVTTIMYLAILGGYFLMFGGGNDDDDILAKYAKRIHQNFFQQVSPLEVARDVISPSGFLPASLRQGWGLIESGGELGVSLLMAGVGAEDAWTQKGTLRGWSQFQRHVPFLSSYKDIAALFEDLSGENYSVQIRR